MLRIFLIVLLCLLPVSAMAGDIKAVEKQLETSRKQQLEQEAQAKSLKKDRDATRDELTALAAAISKNEKDIMTMEERAITLAGEQQQITVRLEADYGSIGNLILGLQRLRRTPPEALIVRPGAPLQTAQTALLLESIMPAITERADALSADLDRLASIRETLEKDRAAILATRADLAKKRQGLDVLLAQREKLYASAESGSAAAARDVKRLAKEAQNLRDLLDKLEKQKVQEGQKQALAGRAVGAVGAALPGLGKAQPPTQGVVTIGYGQADTIGAKSEGITIEAAPSGLVVAPMGGVVRFTGAFRDYGNMVIVEHKKDYHSLIAGLARINVKEGDSVGAGEPVGSLPASSSRGGKPALYYELRQKGRPVDPSSVFSGLKS